MYRFLAVSRKANSKVGIYPFALNTSRWIRVDGNKNVRDCQIPCRATDDPHSNQMSARMAVSEHSSTDLSNHPRPVVLVPLWAA